MMRLDPRLNVSLGDVMTSEIVVTDGKVLHLGLARGQLAENIFLAGFSDRLHPMLLDLGVAVEHNAEFVAGTVLYASPEQVAALAG